MEEYDEYVYAHYEDEVGATAFGNEPDFDYANVDPDGWQENCWTIISAYFDEKGLVRQQLDSFDEFITISAQKIVADAPAIEMIGELEHNTVDDDEQADRFEVKFDQIYLTSPVYYEKDGTSTKLTPFEARLRGLTYSAPLYVDVEKKLIPPDCTAESPECTVEHANKIMLGKIPIMLRSKYCSLYNLSDDDLYELKECPLDPGGYFVINGSEKVIIAQEKMAANIVFCFKKKNSKYRVVL